MEDFIWVTGILALILLSLVYVQLLGRGPEELDG